MMKPLKKLDDELASRSRAKAAAQATQHMGCGKAAPPSELIITPLANKSVRPVKYLIPGRLPLGKLVLAAGRGGSGKSTLLRSVAAALSVGRCALGLSYPNPVTAKTLFIAGEDGPEDTILPSLLAEGANVDRIAILEGVIERGKRQDFTLAPGHVDLIRERLARSPDIRLAIIDPIASFVGRAKIDDHRATELRAVLDPLSELAESSGITIVMVAHLNKASGAGAAVDRVAGSAAYRDAVRAAFLVTEDPEDDSRRLLVPIKENLPGFDRTTIPFALVPLSSTEAAEVLRREQFSALAQSEREEMAAQLRRLKFDTAKLVDADTALRPKKADANKVAKCKEWLRSFLATYAYPSDEILAAAKATGFTFDNVKEAKAELKGEGLRNSNAGTLRGAWWSGFGEQAAWRRRPEPAETTPHSPHTPLSPLSPLSPHSNQRGETGETGETVESRDRTPHYPRLAEGLV
jgi:hypothetical protein